MAGVCTRNVHALQKKKTNSDLEKQLGILFSAMREVAEEFQLDEVAVQENAEEEYTRRLKDR
jgi:Holliday junction resolvasome RuvABC endonuclease subunit